MITGKNSHTEHCCVEHGCKYGDFDCPVANGEQLQSFPCEDCRADTISKFDQFDSAMWHVTTTQPNPHAVNGYVPPKGVIGYMRMQDIIKFLTDGAQHESIGMDHPRCWEDEPPYDWLVPIGIIETKEESK